MWPMVTFVYRTVQRWRRRESEGFSTVEQCYEIVCNTLKLLFTYRPYLLILRAILQLGSFSILAKIRSYMYKLYR